MRFSEAWLREWVNPAIDSETLADQLTMAGLEVDALEPAAPPFSGVQVGRVLGIEAHPNARKLRLCQVDVGESEPLSIICGASNVAEGMRVPVARIGAELPGGHRIERVVLRGVPSEGMICSAAELGLAETSEGILPLPAEAPIGQDIRTYLALDDLCIELDLTPDRSDCLSLAGIAREVGVINRHPVQVPPIEPIPPQTQAGVEVQVSARAACPRYVTRVIEGIDPEAETPLWMVERLRRSGLRAIHPVVDVTNYVLLELGQPMHGFDRGKLNGGIQVRLGHEGESLRLLNGETITLDGDTLVIADAERAIALAGIMGGEDTGVGPDTRDVVLESAFFDPEHISGRARRYGLRTDASHRFERGVDPESAGRALERATALLLAITGGRPGPIQEARYEEALPKPRRLHLDAEKIRRVLGLTLEKEEIQGILTRLGMALEPTETGWTVQPPSHRFDLLEEVDLIAEIGRIFGYARIPTRHAEIPAVPKAPPETAFDLHRARLALVDRGYWEVITYSFVNPDLQGQIEPDCPGLALANPLSPDLSVLRTSLWPGLLQAARYNLARQQNRIRIFETGLRFRLDASELRQEPVLAGLVTGDRDPEQWAAPSRPADFFDLKGDLEALLDLVAPREAFRFLPDEHPALHPGQCARLEYGGQTLGILGMLHPLLAKTLEVPPKTYLFELATQPLAGGSVPRFSPLSKFPAIRRDLAIVLDGDIPYDRVLACVQRAEPTWLREVLLFDLYQGDTIDSGQKSLALGLILQADSQTLTEAEINRSLDRILSRLHGELGAKLRD